MKTMKTIAVAAFLAGLAVPAFAGTLDDVKKKGFIQCGVSTGVPGFSATDDKGNQKGFDVDFCRAMAAAIFADAEKVKYTPLNPTTRFTALSSGEIDVLSRNTTWTMDRDVGLGFDFLGTTYYDGQGFIAKKSLNLKTAKDLNGAAICIEPGTTTELNLADFFRANKLTFKSVVAQNAAEARAAYEAGRCDAYTTDRSGLAAQRSVMKNPEEHVVLTDIISKEPLGPLVRHGDNNWADVGRWTLNALITAEELGVTQANVDQMLSSTNPEIKRLLGAEGDLGTKLGLTNKWAYNIIKQVGNYGEIYDRNLGPKTPLALERGLNNQWNKGGLLYSPPIR